MKKCIAIFIGLVLMYPIVSGADEPKDRQFTVLHKVYKQGSTKTTVSEGYLIYYPENYTTDINESFPVVLSLHGAGENGSDIDVLREKGTQPAGLVEKSNYNFPFILVSPLAKSSMDALGNYDYFEQIMAHVRENNRIDTSREYVVGLSQGGKAARKYAERNAETIAGLISAAGYSGGTNIEGLVAGDVPIILSHNENDTVIKINSSNGYYKKLIAAGATRIIYDIEETGGHNAWSRIFTDMYYWDWLFSFSNELDGIKISDITFSPAYLEEDSPQLELSLQAEDTFGDVQGIESIQVDFSSIGGDIQTMLTSDNNNFYLTYNINGTLEGGSYLIEITAFDVEGNEKKANAEITVEKSSNEAPIINMIQPSLGNYYDEDSTVDIQVEAYDNDGEITLVEFYANDILIGSDTSSPYELLDIDSLTVGEHIISAKAYDDSGVQSQTDDITITITALDTPVTNTGTTILKIEDAGVAYGSSYFPIEKAFDSQPTYLDDNNEPELVDGNSNAPAYSNRYGYIDFGENWEKVRITQTWTLYRSYSAGSHTPYKEVWWDDDVDTINDSNLHEANINFNDAENLVKSSSKKWVLGQDMSDSPIAPKNRYLLLGSPEVMTNRASEYAFVGWIEPDVPPLSISLSSLRTIDTFQTGKETEIVIDATNGDNITRVEYFANDELIATSSISPFSASVNFTNAGDYEVYSLAYEGSETTKSEIETITVEQSLNVIVPTDTGKADGSQYFPMNFAFDSQPTYSDSTFSDVDGGEKAPYYKNRVGYIDFGENWEDVVIAQVYTLYRSSSAGAHVPYSEVWWDDDKDMTNDGITETQINFNSESNLPYQNTVQWAKDGDFSDQPITAKGRYLMLRSPSNMNNRALEYLLLGSQ